LPISPRTRPADCRPDRGGRTRSSGHRSRGSETESTDRRRAHHSRPKATKTSNCLIRTPFLRHLSSTRCARRDRPEAGRRPRYRKFESIPLQQTVCLSPAVFFEGREPGFPRGSGAAGWTIRSAETRRYFDMAPNPSNISVGPYSSTAVSLIWAARMPERNQAFSRLNRAVDL
jgi:hypothetical protein